MQRTPAATVAPVKGAPTASYRSIDLGHDGDGRLVLTYCAARAPRAARRSPRPRRHRVSFKRLAPKRCELTAAPSRWGSRVAYGLACDKLRGTPHVRDAKRSGLFVRRHSGAPKRLRLPKDAVRFGADHIRRVDLRGTIVGATASDIYAYAFAQTVNATHLRVSFAAASEGDSDEFVAGQSLGSGGVLWTLVDATPRGDPNESRISRLSGGDCADSEAINGPPEAEGYPADALAVDGATLYLSVPGTGIVTHAFSPTFTCS